MSPQRQGGERKITPGIQKRAVSSFLDPLGEPALRTSRRSLGKLDRGYGKKGGKGNIQWADEGVGEDHNSTKSWVSFVRGKNPLYYLSHKRGGGEKG